MREKDGSELAVGGGKGHDFGSVSTRWHVLLASHAGSNQALWRALAFFKTRFPLRQASNP